MGKIKNRSIKTSMTIAFLIALCAITILSAITIFVSNQIQQQILKQLNLTVNSYNFKLDENTGNYVLSVDDAVWQPLSTVDNIVYYGAYVAMIGLPAIYSFVGIGITATVYYRKKLRCPITQLQTGVEKIQENDLDFHIEYNGNDELGELCSSMEKMRRELRKNNKALWEALEQRKLLNASVSHDLRTPITVLKGYLDYLERNVPQDKLTEDMLLDTVSSMQGAVARLEQYVECVRDIEKVENIELKCQPENTKPLLLEIENIAGYLKQDKEIVISSNVLLDEINIDKSVFFRIFENLLQNALRYAEHQVQINILQKDAFLTLTVKDDGQGFSETDLENAITVFFSREKEHFGIGLSICKVLCEKHGGCLNITNNKEKGACVIAKIKIF